MPGKSRPTLREFVRKARSLLVHRPFVDAAGIRPPQTITIELKPLHLLPSKINEQIQVRSESPATQKGNWVAVFHYEISDHSPTAEREIPMVLLQYDLGLREELSPQQIDLLRDELQLWGVA